MEGEGLLAPRGPALWDPLAGQDLVDELLLGAEPVYVAMQGWCGLEEAARRMGQTLPHVIAEIRSGRLRVGRYMQRAVIASVLISPGHRTQEDGSISVAAFASWMGLSNSGLMGFLRRNDMPFQKVAGPRGGAQLRMSKVDQQAFHDRFISFLSLGVKARLSWADLRRHLAEQGIMPAGGSDRIYDCRAVTHLFI